MAKASSASWAFLIGVILAVILGIISYANSSPDWQRWLGILLVIIGIVVGLTNIDAKEAHSYMIAGTILVVIAALSGNVFSDLWFLPNILTAIMMLFTPSVIITAIKQVWGMAKSK